MAIQIDGDGIGVSALSTTAKAELKSGRKNLIINGAMQVAQRGTSQSTNGYGSLDRWRMALSGGTGTMSQESFTVGQTDVPGEPKNYMKLNVTTGNDNCGIEYRIEDVRNGAGQACTLSFYAKGTNPGGGSVYVNFEQRFDGSNEVLTNAGTFTLTSSWQKFTIPVTLPSITGKTVGASSYLRLQINQYTDTSTSAWELNMANVQLEVGDTATDFEHRSYGEELALCQRYYFKPADQGWMGQFLNNNTNLMVHYMFPVQMRSVPSVSTAGGFLFNKPGIAGGASATYSSPEKRSVDCASINYVSVSTTGSYGDTVVVATSDAAFDSEL